MINYIIIGKFNGLYIWYFVLQSLVMYKLSLKLLLASLLFHSIKSPEPTNQYNNTSEYLLIDYLLFKQQFHYIISIISSPLYHLLTPLKGFLFFYIFKKYDLLLLKKPCYWNLRFHAIILEYFLYCCCRYIGR
jgi:hypothetical protein